MFNALKGEDLLVGIARVLRLVADAPGALEEYERSQALSAYSVSRLLAAEQRAAAGLLDDTKRALRDALGPAAGDEPAIADAARAVDAAADGTEVGEAVSRLLAALPAQDPRRARIHRALADMADAEVAALADVPS